MLTQQEYNEYIKTFAQVLDQNKNFLSRFPGFPELPGKKVLDLGCGHGALCYDLARKGAFVVGVDLDTKRIEFAQRYLTEIDPEVSTRLQFSSADIKDVADSEFDIIISKSTFEHVMDLEEMLKILYNKLKINGRLYAGFGPLYNSFDGDHKLITRIPWGHLFLSEKMVLKKFAKKTGETIERLEDTTFNMLSFKEYERIFQESNFQIEHFDVNVSNNPIMKLFSWLRVNSFLKECFSRNIYCVLVKTANRS